MKTEMTMTVDLNKDIALCVYLSIALNIDLLTLIFLYEKYNKDLFYFFYLFSGKKLTIPTPTRFHAMVKQSDTLLKEIKKNKEFIATNEITSDQDIKDLTIVSQESKKYIDYLKQILTEDKTKINLSLEIEQTNLY